MTRVTKMGTKRHLDATPYDQFNNADDKTNSSIRKRAPLPPQNVVEESLGLKRKRSEHRRVKREDTRNQGKVCFRCREEGHRVQDCPEAANDEKDNRQICYRCGKSNHSLKQCRLAPSKGLPFAQCYVCKKTGHITSNCPTNGNGVYPTGGCCKICQSTEHLARDCPVPDEVQQGTVVGARRVNTSADNDDFHEVAQVQITRNRAAALPKTGIARKVVSF